MFVIVADLRVGQTSLLECYCWIYHYKISIEIHQYIIKPTCMLQKLCKLLTFTNYIILNSLSRPIRTFQFLCLVEKTPKK